MCLTFKHLFKHLVNKGHSIPVLVYLQDFYNNPSEVWPRSARVERPFPTLSIPWVWSLSTWLASWLCVVQESFYFSLRKRWHHNCHRLWWHCGCRFPFSRTLFPSSCDVFSWLLSLFVTSLVCAFLLSRFVHNIMTLYGITHHCSVVVWVSWHQFSPHNTVYESHM